MWYKPSQTAQFLDLAVGGGREGAQVLAVHLESLAELVGGGERPVIKPWPLSYLPGLNIVLKISN